MLKAEEIRDKSLAEIEACLKDARHELFVLLNDAQRNKKMEKPHMKTEKRKEIARLLTVKRSKQAAEVR